MGQQKSLALYLTKNFSISESQKMRNLLTFSDKFFDDIYE